jgi:ABC-type nickel/cobalt efflux system permease component RcnA
LHLADIAMPQGFPVWATLVLGFVLGLRHALDGDHVAAVATFTSEERNLWRSSLIGAYWGAGHSVALLVFGSVIVALRLAVSDRISQTLEFAVGIMLIILGINALRKVSRSTAIHVHTHEHDGTLHSHLHVHLGDAGHSHQHRLLRVAGRPFLVGIVHGLAGTAAVLLLVVGAIPSALLALGVLLIFGVGTIGGMMAMSVLMSVPLAFAAGRVKTVERVLRYAAGAFSLAFGLFLAWDVGLIQALMR